MRVLIANHRYVEASGAERYLFNISAELEARGHGVMPFAMRHRHNAPSPYEHYFVSPIDKQDRLYFSEYRDSPKALGASFARLFYSKEVEQAAERMARETHADIAYVLLYLRKLSPSLLVGLKRAGVPIVVRLSDYGMFCAQTYCLRDGKPCTACQGGALAPSVLHGCVEGSRAVSAVHALAMSWQRARGYFDLVDQFVVTNDFMLETMQHAGFPANRLTCIPTFVDTDRFAPSSEPRDDYILFCGRLHQVKGAHVLIDALRLLKAQGRRVRLKIAGTGQDPRYVETLKRQVEAAHLRDQVEFEGQIDAAALPRLYQRALCSVVPALWFENLPNALLESLACGTPVIASDIGSLASTLSDGADGLLFPVGDAAALAAQIARLLDDPSLGARLAQGARRTAVELHAAERHVTRLLDLFGSFARCGVRTDAAASSAGRRAAAATAPPMQPSAPDT
ncbi:MAG TPA: glycosyltransferase family 4 protein [Vitreimonas sp.]|nr:glycosyltransferase family 4 protein [Vitreimonas sp.]